MKTLSQLTLLCLAVVLIASLIYYLEPDNSPPPQITSAPSPSPASPDLRGITAWINSDPLTLQQLKGKVVLIDFWTYTCINCIRTLPYLTSWDEKYRDKGLVIIGVHSPEFDFEKELGNVKAAVEKYNIQYPVALDNEYATWQAFDNHYWPHKFLFNKDGEMVYDHIGEGAYEETEAKIQDLLQELGQAVDMPLTPETPRPSLYQTPELYAGYAFTAGRIPLGNPEGQIPETVQAYALPPSLTPDRIYLTGRWESTRDTLRHADTEPASIVLRFTAKTVNIVLAPQGDSQLEILLDGQPLTPEQAGNDVIVTPERSYAFIREPRLYNLLGESNTYGTHTLQLITAEDTFAFSAFTFGQ